MWSGFRCVAGAVVVIVLSSLSVASGAEVASTDGSALVIPSLSRPPRLEEFLPMELDAPPLGMVRIEGLVARTPRDGEPVSERTVVYLGYDDANVYAAFVCFDRARSEVGAHLAGRDRMPDADDSVSLMLDTFRDRKHAYGFQSNALGVQTDGLWTEGAGWDLSFDSVWSSQARLTEKGYVVLVVVPFKSLRFPRQDVQSWGFFVYRGIPRKNEECYWPAYSSRLAGRLNQAGALEGLSRVAPGHNAQLLPYTQARSSRFLEAASPQGARFVSEAFHVDAGLDGKVVIHDSLALDLTLRPDFSQVESDEPQVTVNKRFETLFPEKRPFFLENASYFDTPIPLLFTRRIADPGWGARLTGRLGPYALGGLLVADDGPQAAADRNALVGAVRINRDVGAESAVGVFLGSRTAGGHANVVAAADARLKIDAQWVATLQAAVSTTGAPGQDAEDGFATSASVLRSGHRVTYSALWNDRSLGFRSAPGFIDRLDVRSLDQTATYRQRPTGRRLLSWGPDLTLGEAWDHAGRHLETTVSPRMSFEWPGLTTLSVYYKKTRERLRPREVPALASDTTLSEDRVGVEIGTSFTRALSFALKAAAGKGVNLTPAPQGSVEPGDVLELTSSLDVRPSASLTLGTSYLLTRLADPATGATIFTDEILREKVSYQFTRAASVRAIVEYARLSADPARSGLPERKGVDVDLLLTYLRSPGTGNCPARC